MLGLDALADDPRFRTNRDRLSARGELHALLVERLRTRPAAEWLVELKAAGVPCGGVRDLAEVFSDPQIVERAMVVASEHPAAGAIRQLGVPVKLGDTPGAVRTPPPLLGQHTRDVLVELGYADAEIGRFREAGAI